MQLLGRTHCSLVCGSQGRRHDAGVLLLDMKLGKSFVPHENTSFYVGQKILATLKALGLSVASHVVLFDLMHASDNVRYNLLSENTTRIGSDAIQRIGMLFIAFEVIDAVLGTIMGTFSLDLIAHHCVFVVMGLIVWRNQCLIYQAAIMMTFETSSIWLNPLLLLRHRRPRKDLTVTRLRTLFGLSFCIWRLGMGTWGLYEFYTKGFWWLLTTAHPVEIWTCCAMLISGQALQYYWGVRIVLQMLS